MKTIQTTGSNKQTIIVKDLKTKKNPRGGEMKIKLTEVLISSFRTNTQGGLSGGSQGYLK